MEVDWLMVAMVCNLTLNGVDISLLNSPCQIEHELLLLSLIRIESNLRENEQTTEVKKNKPFQVIAQTQHRVLSLNH